MPVFDFSNSKTEKKDPECTYTTFQSNEKVPSPEKPILIIDNKSRQWKHHSCGVFSNPNQKSSFEFKEQDGVFPADILKIDARFVSLVKWLGENHISVRLSGQNTEDGYAIYKIRETAFGGAGKLSAEDGFLQFMIERLLASNAPTELPDGDEEDEDGDDVADGASVAGEATFPYFGNLAEVLRVIVPGVEKDVSEAGADDGCHDDVDEENPEPAFRRTFVAEHFRDNVVTDDEAHGEGQSVPAHRQWAEAENGGIGIPINEVKHPEKGGWAGSVRGLGGRKRGNGERGRHRPSRGRAVPASSRCWV